jgi:micrococcal nuclease
VTLRGALFTLLMLLAGMVNAAIVRGTVSHVSDGDTLWLRPAGGGAPQPVRILDIDAPEGCQAYGPQARAALGARVLRQPVRLLTRGEDDYGRTLARVEHRGEDVGAWMVEQGNAWSMTFRRKPGPYAGLETQARQARRGLWAGPAPMAPRSFRQRFGRCQP